MPYGVSWKNFFKDLNQEVSDDNVYNGAAALAYYSTLAIFPAMLLLLSLIPYLPIANVDHAIMDLLTQSLPGDSGKMFSSVITEVTQNKKGGLLSFGALATLWAASNGIYAIMQQLNITYDVKEGRSFFKVRGIALGLTIALGVLIISAFSMVVLGGQIQEWLASSLGFGDALLVVFAVVRWAVIASALLLAFATCYYFGPDVEQKFKFISPGSILGVILLVAATLGFRVYITNFSDYSATYGSIGAVIVMMLWFYIGGLVILLGSEINALIEHYSPEGKDKGEKTLGENHLNEKPRHLDAA